MSFERGYIIEFIGGPLDGQRDVVETFFDVLLCHNDCMRHVYEIRRGEKGIIVKNGHMQYQHVPSLTELVK